MMDDFKPRRARVFAADTKKPESIKEEVQPVITDPPEVSTIEPAVSSPTPDPIETPGNAAKISKMPVWLQKVQKKQWALIGISLVTLIGCGATYALTNPGPVPEPDIPPIVKAVEPPPPTTVASRLTGVQVAPELNELPVTAVMIENSPEARPQSGLADAGVVFEAIAEGGITRFSALYQEAQPDYIGPVRSLRPYYLDLVLPFDPAISHAGGSGQALAEVAAQGVKSLDHSSNGGAYQRVRDRFAPHNLYTGRPQLLEAQRAKGYTSSTFVGYVRKTESPAESPTANTIALRVSSATYNSSYTYESESNSYLRTMAGVPHVDQRSGTQIKPKVVVALVAPHSYAGIYSVYQIIGNGKAFIFQDGSVTEGVWEKTSRTSQITFGDANGAPLGLNAGQTWITLVGDAGRVTYTP